MRFEVEWEAERFLRIAGKSQVPDRRFNSGTIKGQMQEIYLAAQQIGIKMNKKHLVETWLDRYSEAYEYDQLLRERSHMIRTQANLAKRIKAISEKIRQHHLAQAEAQA